MKKPHMIVGALLLLCFSFGFGCHTGLGGLPARLLLGSGATSRLGSGLFQPGGMSTGDGGLVQTGACCLASGDCLTVTAADCEAYAGVYHGPGLTCGVAPCGSGF